MEIIVNNVRFNISAEDLETAQAEFSFWKGRRFTFCGKDLKEHFLRYNDIMQAVLAEDATFAEDDDRQCIYKALSNLKDQGYPHEDSCGISWMLWLKQLFGNIFRQTLVDQLNSKLHEEEIEELSASEGDDQAPLSPFCHEPALIGIVCKYASRSVFRLAATCKLFAKYIEENPICKRDFTLLKKIFNLAQLQVFQHGYRRYKPDNDSVEMTDIESKCIRLIAEFLPKEAYKITPFNKVYEQDEDYAKHQQRLVTVLADIDLKSALKVVPFMDEERYPVQTFCAVAAIYKNNPSFCDEERVFALAEEAYHNPHIIQRNQFFRDGSSGCTCHSIDHSKYFPNLMEVLEASISVRSRLAKRFLKEMNYVYEFQNNYLPYLLKSIKKIGIPSIHELKLENTLIKFLRNKIKVKSINRQTSQGLAIVAKIFRMLDQEEMAIQALDLALNAIKNELQKEKKVEALISIAEAFAEFDQTQSFEVAQQALTEINDLYEWNKLYSATYHLYRHSIFQFLHRVTQVLLKSDREFAIQALEKNVEQLRVMDKKVVTKANWGVNGDYVGFYKYFPSELFMGALEIYPQIASGMVNAAVEWARTNAEPTERIEIDLLALSQILITSYPDQALEVANMLKLPGYKCKALLAIVSKGSSLHDID